MQNHLQDFSPNYRQRLFGVLLAASIGLFCGASAFALPPSEEPLYDGIDVSEYQADIDFAAVKQAGIEIVYIRSSAGADSVDTYFETNYQKAKANGLKVGFYHYVTARNAEEAAAQARFFWSLIASKEADCLPAMDFEEFNGLTVRQINTIAQSFLGELEEQSQLTPLLYSNAYDAEQVFDASLTAYPLWIAEYDVDEPSDNGKWSSWFGFQYTGEGRVDGISVVVDRDKFTPGVLLPTKLPPVTGNF